MYRHALAAAFVLGMALVASPEAWGCSCAGVAPSSRAVRAVDVIFIGKVTAVTKPRWQSRTDADGSVSVSPTGEPSFATFELVRMFRGGFSQELIEVRAHGPCDPPFAVGEVWLVYAGARDGLAETSICSRSRLLSEATQDLEYLEGLELGRAQGILYGDVLQEVLDASGSRVALRAVFEPLQVVAEGAGRRAQVTTDRWGPFQLVLPPGDFDVWVERHGTVVASRRRVHITDGQDERAVLIATYKE